MFRLAKPETRVRIPYPAQIARLAQLVEHELAKFGVVSSNLISRSKNETIHFRLYSDAGRPYKETTDLMVGYNPENMKMYMINPNDFNAEKIVSLKLNKPKNNQTKGINVAENYLL